MNTPWKVQILASFVAVSACHSAPPAQPSGPPAMSAEPSSPASSAAPAEPVAPASAAPAESAAPATSAAAPPASASAPSAAPPASSAKAEPEKKGAPEKAPAPGVAAPAASADTGYTGEDACGTKNFHYGQLKSACHTGGRKAAKAFMKSVVQKAKAAGTELKCTSCHEDMSTFTLKANAVGDLKKWL